MSNDDVLSFMEEFAEESTKSERPQDLFPHVEAPYHHEITKGAWALQLDPTMLNTLQEGMVPVDLRCRVGYVFDDPDFIALSATQGGDYAEMVAANNKRYADNQRYGRWYDKEHPNGELGEEILFTLFPLTEEQADAVRFFEFRVPVITATQDWFMENLTRCVVQLDELSHEEHIFYECPTHHKPLIARIVYTGQASVLAFDTTLMHGADHPVVQLGQILQDSIGGIDHVHLHCKEEGCGYDQHLDLNEYEVLRPSGAICDNPDHHHEDEGYTNI